MTGPHSETESPGTRPISVAELLAKNGTLGAPAVTRRRRRRRGDNDAVTVAELTGDIPVVRDDQHDSEHDTAHEANGTTHVTERASEVTDVIPETEDHARAPYWSEPEPRWPKSPPPPQRVSKPERSAYPRPLPHVEAGDGDGQSGAEDMSPDPVDHYADMPVDVMDAEVHDAEPATDDSAYVRSFLRESDSTLFGGQTLADEIARRGGAQADEVEPDVDAEPAAGTHDGRGLRDRFEAVWQAGVVVLQSVLAVAFGAGLFVAFDELWRWNSIVALVLSVLVILGLVVGVRVVRKTEDIASTLIAVAVGALITLGPLALSLQSG
jgi:hypothetical protein